MLTIHHATRARAAKSDLEFVVDGDTFDIVETRTGKRFVILNGDEEISPKEALDEAIEMMEEVIAERLEEEEDQPVKRTLAKCITPYRAEYALHNDSCGDELSYEIKAFVTYTDPETGKDCLDLLALQSLADQNGFEYRWSHLNPGQQRMCLGNKLRQKLLSGEDVHIGGRVLAGIDATDYELLVKAIRADKMVGTGSCSQIDECYSTAELMAALKDAKVRTASEAVKWARRTDRHWKSARREAMAA